MSRGRLQYEVRWSHFTGGGSYSLRRFEGQGDARVFFWDLIRKSIWPGLATWGELWELAQEPGQDDLLLGRCVWRGTPAELRSP